MTNAHENLDRLSKRVEEQELPSSPNVSVFQEKQTTVKQLSDQRGYTPIAPQKQVISLPPLNTPSQVPVENNHQPPPGFKVSYALAYVPVFVPDKIENESEESRKNE